MKGLCSLSDCVIVWELSLAFCYTPKCSRVEQCVRKFDALSLTIQLQQWWVPERHYLLCRLSIICSGRMWLCVGISAAHKMCEVETDFEITANRGDHVCFIWVAWKCRTGNDGPNSKTTYELYYVNVRKPALLSCLYRATVYFL